MTDRKSIANLGLSVGGVIIEGGGGEGEYVTVTSPERGGAKVGVHGDIVFFDLPNKLYNVTITLLETSAGNRNMQELHNRQANKTYRGTFDFVLEDIGTSEILTGQAVFLKEPDRAKAAEASNYQWQLLVGSDTPWEYSERSTV
jgi:hypothetical protein